MVLATQIKQHTKTNFVELSQRLLRERLTERGAVSVVILNQDEGAKEQLMEFKRSGLNAVYQYQFGSQYLFSLLK